MIRTPGSQPCRAGPSPAAETPEIRTSAISLAALVALVACWRARIRRRRDLAVKLAEAPHLVRDLGLSRRKAETEIAKPFWRR